MFVYLQEIDEQELRQVKWIYSFAEGNKNLKELLGSKGANLAEMTRMGIPVPPGFIITTELCREYLKTGQVPSELEDQVNKSLAALESQLSRNFGDAKHPLLVAVRSGAKISMPGMMETILNVGLNDQSVEGPIVLDGTVLGAVGVSGATSAQDDEIALLASQLFNS